MTTERDNIPVPGNLLYGADAIAHHLGIGPKQVYYLHDKGSLPTFKVGAKVCARRADLDAWLEAAATGGRDNG